MTKIRNELMQDLYRSQRTIISAIGEKKSPLTFSEKEYLYQIAVSYGVMIATANALLNKLSRKKYDF